MSIVNMFYGFLGLNGLNALFPVEEVLRVAAETSKEPQSLEANRALI